MEITQQWLPFNIADSAMQEVMLSATATAIDSVHNFLYLTAVAQLTVKDAVGGRDLTKYALRECR